ncbi:hypothetical protein L9G16_19420, partial [Shewanella sp. A25]|nr:hypothetical protein [Shewanella shenzhenensis]
PEEKTGKVVFLKDSTCPTARPWCDSESGTCTDKVPPRCGAQDNFVCLKKNQYFPDSNCHQFHFCDDKYESKLFKCNPETKVFNPIPQQCDDPSVTKRG